MDSPLIQPPTGFSRATGVKEGRRKCVCGNLFPTTSNDQVRCPQCGSPHTTPVVDLGAKD